MKTFNIIYRILLIVVCIIGIILPLTGVYSGFIYLDDEPYEESYIIVEDERYGGDAYTGIQNAVADTANNVRILGEHIKILNKRGAAVEQNSAALCDLLTTVTALAFTAFLLINIKKLVEEIRDNSVYYSENVIPQQQAYRPVMPQYQPSDITNLNINSSNYEQKPEYTVPPQTPKTKNTYTAEQKVAPTKPESKPKEQDINPSNNAPLEAKLSFALKYTTDASLIDYLKTINDPRVHAILSMPNEKIRDEIQLLIDKEYNKSKGWMCSCGAKNKMTAKECAFCYKKREID